MDWQNEYTVPNGRHNACIFIGHLLEVDDGTFCRLVRVMPDVHMKLSAAHCCKQHCKCNVRPHVWQIGSNGKLLMCVQGFKVFPKLAACLIFMPKEYTSRSAEVCCETLCCWALPCSVRIADDR